MAFEYLLENLQNLQSSIAECCMTCDRLPTEISLLPVTKRQPLEKLKALYELGERHFAENRVQEMLDKAALLPQDICWHLIGPLQKNKVRQALKYARTIHSVDSLKLLNRIERIAGEEDVEVDVFLQVNLTGEEQKSGFEASELASALAATSDFKNVKVVGLMTMGAAAAEDSETSLVFSQLKELQEGFKMKYVDMKELSMGMSGDYQLAIQQGSTFIRVGSLLLGERES